MPAFDARPPATPLRSAVSPRFLSAWGAVYRKDFIAKNCEKPDLPCSIPADCPNGLVCCLSAIGLKCLPALVCPGDRINTWRACVVDSDCPPPTIGSCQPAEVVNGTAVNICS